MDEQFQWYVDQATTEVYADGLKASPQAVMFYCFGQISTKLEARVIRLDGKLAVTIVALLSTLVGGVAGRLL